MEPKKQVKPGATAAEALKRVLIVQEWILADLSRSNILDRCVKEYEVSKRQAERYYKKAFDLFEEISKVSVEKKKGYYLQRKRKLISDMPDQAKKTPAGVLAVNKVLDSMAQLDGVITTKVEVSGKDGAPIEQNYNITLNIK